ncbi:MAG TPA: beta-1,6-glucan synthase [Xanthobacteraceae bacterium]|nr:beta-1,6-glucan synthase [Xanthobacteraceae bacterium]
MRFPVALAASVGVAILAAWAWLGWPVNMPPTPYFAPDDKLPCVSYAPFRPGQSPFIEGLVIPPEQIDDDFARLSKITACVRTYSTEMGLSVAPELARKHGLTLLQGIWIGREPDKNRIEIEAGIKLAQQNPDVVKGVIVGNEVLLRGELTAADLGRVIRDVRARAGVPVTYADVWEFWVRNRELAADVDFVTVHILPFWEDLPVSADDAVAHIDSIRAHVGEAFPGRDILIGETGWPSAGRMREGAEPSPANQAQVIQQLLSLAKQRSYRLNVIEAFDQPWKRALEGTVGGHWGFLDAYSRDFKFAWAQPVSNHPLWPVQALLGLAVAGATFAAAAWGARRAGQPAPEPLQWLPVAGIALAAGIAYGWAVAAVWVESLGPWGWLRGLVLLALGLAAPLVAAAALGARAPRPVLATALQPARWSEAPGVEIALAVVLALTVVLATQIGFGLVFDPRYKDFQFAALTPIIAALAIQAAVAAPAGAGERHAERIAAAVFAASGVYIALNETLANWQALWTGTLMVLFALTLWRTSAARG